MEAACWKNQNTFWNYYLRDTKFTNEDIMTLGPVVAGQGIVGASSDNPSNNIAVTFKTSMGRSFVIKERFKM